jgi:hypothetical protein
VKQNPQLTTAPRLQSAVNLGYPFASRLCGHVKDHKAAQCHVELTGGERNVFNQADLKGNVHSVAGGFPAGDLDHLGRGVNAMPSTYVPHLGAHCSMAVCGDIIRLGQYCTLALTNHVPLCIP